MICYRLDNLLAEVLDLIHSGDGVTSINLLCNRLADFRAKASPREWTIFKRECLEHPIREVLHQDPYTHRAFTKPRGYAGDAVMLDYLYSGRFPVGTTPLGQTVFEGTTTTSNGRSVVERRDHFARIIDEEAEQVSGLRVVSLACGHLREAQQSKAARNGKLTSSLPLTKIPKAWLSYQENRQNTAEFRQSMVP